MYQTHLPLLTLSPRDRRGRLSSIRRTGSRSLAPKRLLRFPFVLFILCLVESCPAICANRTSLNTLFLCSDSVYARDGVKRTRSLTLRKEVRADAGPRTPFAPARLIFGGDL